MQQLPFVFKRQKLAIITILSLFLLAQWILEVLEIYQNFS